MCIRQKGVRDCNNFIFLSLTCRSLLINHGMAHHRYENLSTTYLLNNITLKYKLLECFILSCVSQNSPHVATIAAGTWEAAPAQAPVNTMETVVLITTVGIMSLKTMVTILTEKHLASHWNTLLTIPFFINIYWIMIQDFTENWLYSDMNWHLCC